MKQEPGIYFSVILHIIVFLLVAFGFPALFPQKPVEEAAITVEILPITSVSNVKTQKKKTDTEPPKEIQESKEVVKARTDDSEMNLEEQKKEYKKPEEESPEKKPDEKKEIIKEEKKEEKKKEEKKKEDKKKEDKKKNLQKTKTKATNELDALLKSLEKPATKKTEDAKKKQSDNVNDAQDEENTKGQYDEAQPLSIRDKDMIVNQIEKHWSVPVAAKNAEQLKVVLFIKLDIDGTVAEVKVLERPASGLFDENLINVTVDSAIRAVKKASPFQNLPKNTYKSWKELEINFDPVHLIF